MIAAPVWFARRHAALDEAAFCRSWLLGLWVTRVVPRTCDLAGLVADAPTLSKFLCRFSTNY